MGNDANQAKSTSPPTTSNTPSSEPLIYWKATSWRTQRATLRLPQSAAKSWAVPSVITAGLPVMKFPNTTTYRPAPEAAGCAPGQRRSMMFTRWLSWFVRTVPLGKTAPWVLWIALGRPQIMTPECSGCGAKVNDDGYSIDDRCCSYCKAD